MSTFEMQRLATDIEALVAQEDAVDAVPPEVVKALFGAVAKLYALKNERDGDEHAPFFPEGITPTVVVVCASAMLRAANLNIFDLAMWFSRPAWRP